MSAEIEERKKLRPTGGVAIGIVRPNHPASGNGAMTSLFHVERLDRAVPEPGR